MKKNKIGKIFRKISAFVLACGMVVTSVGTGTISSYAADSTDKVCTIELASNENGKMFSPTGETDSENGTIVSYKAGETAKIQVVPDDGYFLKNISFKSDNDTKVKPTVAGTEYSFDTTDLNKVTVKATFAADSEKKLI